MKENALLPLQPLHQKERYQKKKTDFEQMGSVSKSVFSIGINFKRLLKEQSPRDKAPCN